MKDEILSRLAKLLDVKPLGPATPIPAPVLLNSQSRAGISPTRITQRVLERESEIYSYDEPHRRMIAVIVEELVRELQENGLIEIAIAPSTQIVNANGASAAGPVTVVGTVVNPVKGTGVIR